jgi:hypothetical protein
MSILVAATRCSTGTEDSNSSEISHKIGRGSRRAQTRATAER